MILVGLLNTDQKTIIAGKEYAPDSFFNPIQDISDNWIISTQEIQQCEEMEYIFVKTLPLIEFIPKPVNPFT